MEYVQLRYWEVSYRLCSRIYNLRPWGRPTYLFKFESGFPPSVKCQRLRSRFALDFWSVFLGSSCSSIAVQVFTDPFAAL
ncbi:hypothetical protein BV898_19822 [Hypsibius exemplaris]|uniref:Uncharacterized protein n=1 Tax=Hypsibius exemplaris TaxID=2072580 RepID=A0A9X6NJY4_HYPEX|nr:hypothetical protein BV898_19822 [Hypsibius exemplaris]